MTATVFANIANVIILIIGFFLYFRSGRNFELSKKNLIEAERLMLSAKVDRREADKILAQVERCQAETTRIQDEIARSL